MDIQKYIDQQKELYSQLLKYIDEKDNECQNFKELIKIIQTQKIQENRAEFKLLLSLISKISNNHFHSPGFFTKIEKITTYFSDDMKRYFNDEEIFNIFKGNKRLILHFIKNKIITITLSIVNKMIPDDESENRYYYYFFPEVRSFLNKNDQKMIINELIKNDPKIFNNFEENRQKGENESRICSLIRQDLIDEFIVFVNETNIQLDSKVKFSIFETNRYLIKNQPTLIEYAAFFGSIKIIQYLMMKSIELTSSLWLYAIHSNNPEIFQFLEENDVKYDDSFSKEMYKEAIKCHHNDFANFIYDNKITENGTKTEFRSDKRYYKDKVKKISNYDKYFEQDINSYGFRYYNCLFWPNDLEDPAFYYACYYDYIKIVEYFLNTGKRNFINDNLIHFKYIYLDILTNKYFF